MPQDVLSTQGLARCLLGSWKPGVDTSLQPERQTLHKAQLTNPLPRSLGLTLHNLEAQSPYSLGRASEGGNSWVDQQQWGSGVQGADSSVPEREMKVGVAHTHFLLSRDSRWDLPGGCRLFPSTHRQHAHSPLSQAPLQEGG